MAEGTHTLPLKPGVSTNAQQDKAVAASQAKSHNASVSDNKGLRPTVKK